MWLWFATAWAAPPAPVPPAPPPDREAQVEVAPCLGAWVTVRWTPVTVATAELCVRDPAFDDEVCTRHTGTTGAVIFHPSGGWNASSCLDHLDGQRLTVEAAGCETWDGHLPVRTLVARVEEESFVVDIALRCEP